MIKIGVDISPPFAGFESVAIKLGKEPGLWVVDSVPILSDAVSYGDVVLIDIRTAHVVEVVEESGFWNAGLLYDPRGEPRERVVRLMAASRWLDGFGIVVAAAGTGVILAAVPGALDYEMLDKVAENCPTELRVHTEHARFAVVNMDCPGCGYRHV